MTNEKTYCVYIHTNQINNKKYIGQTCQKPEYRWGGRGQGYKNSPHFYAAIEQYGWENFTHEIIAIGLTADEANELEVSLIKMYDTTNPTKGYNSETGGKRNHTVSLETRQKQSASAMARPNVTQETKEKLSAVSKGITRTVEQIEKYSLAAKKREAERCGQKYSPVICLNTGEYFPTCRAAADWCGLVGVSGISSVCKNGKQKTAGVHPITKEKLKWRYATNAEIRSNKGK